MNTTQWADHLESIASPALAGTPLGPDAGDHSPDRIASFIDTFTDELGHRRATDRPLLCRLLGVEARRPASRDDQADVELWWALQTGADPWARVHGDAGPLVGEEEFARGAIEATTETELSALHALSHHARAEGGASVDEAIEARAFAAARWHVDTLQPDNGTNHPWAIHVFVRLSEADPAYGAGAALHAEGLLHNAMVRAGRPDRFSACVLLDAARALRSDRPA
jgi:hypothetical protein